jgi:DNA polymerase III epsilon subunit-like protein
MSITANGYPCCYARPRFQSVKKIRHEMGEKHEKQLVSLLKQGILRKVRNQWNLAVSLEKFKNYKIIVYDLETTGLPYGTNLPDVTQISMYSPQSNEYFVSYVKPQKPITAFASYLTKIYATFKDLGGYYDPDGHWIYRNPFMRTPFYQEIKAQFAKQMSYPEIDKFDIAVDTIIDAIHKHGFKRLNITLDQIGDTILNDDGFYALWEQHSTMQRDEVIDMYLSVLEANPQMLDEFVKKLPDDIYQNMVDNVFQVIKKEALKDLYKEQHQQIVEEVVRKYKVKSLENEPAFGEIADNIDKFIKKGTNRDTIIIMVAHNGQSFDEPILRDSFRKLNKGFYFTDNILFVDSYLMALQWIEKAKTLNFKLGTLYEKFLNEEMPGWHDAKDDVTGLWKMIVGLFAEVWKNNDISFIALKFIEFFYASHLINEEYLRSVADEIFHSKEYEHLDLGSEKISGVEAPALEAPFG